VTTPTSGAPSTRKVPSVYNEKDASVDTSWIYIARIAVLQKWSIALYQVVCTLINIFIHEQYFCARFILTPCFVALTVFSDVVRTARNASRQKTTNFGHLRTDASVVSHQTLDHVLRAHELRPNDGAPVNHSQASSAPIRAPFERTQAIDRLASPYVSKPPTSVPYNAGWYCFSAVDVTDYAPDATFATYPLLDHVGCPLQGYNQLAYWGGAKWYCNLLLHLTTKHAFENFWGGRAIVRFPLPTVWNRGTLFNLCWDLVHLSPNEGGWFCKNHFDSVVFASLPSVLATMTCAWAWCCFFVPARKFQSEKRFFSSSRIYSVNAAKKRNNFFVFWKQTSSRQKASKTLISEAQI